MATKLPFAVGDPVILNGQTIVLTVTPPPANQAGETVTREGWIWVAYASQAGLGFHHLPIACLVPAKAPARTARR